MRMIRILIDKLFFILYKVVGANKNLSSSCEAS